MNSSQAALPAGGARLPAALPVALAGLCAAGAGGNLLLLAVLAREARRGRSPAGGGALLALCAADLLLALGCLPARLAAPGAGPLGAALCRAGAWLLHGCLAAKSLCWAAAGHARLRHARSPARRPARPRGRLAGALAALWAAALLLPLPVLLFTRLEAGGRGGPLRCALRSPPSAARFMDVFGKVYPLAALVAPSAVCWACFGRALRLQRARKERPAAPGRRATGLLFCLSLLFQATWLPAWVVWLWEWHAPLAGSPRPPPALLFLAEALVFLDGAASPGVLLAASAELREGLRGVWRALHCRRAAEGAGGAAAGEPAQSLRDLEAAAAAEKVLPDVEHFWKDRRNTAAGEENDPIPWEHQCEP